MGKWIIPIILLMFLLPSTIALKECITPTSPGKIPCLIISSYTYSDTCSSNTMQVFDSEGTSVENSSMIDYGSSGFCYLTWNRTTLGSYVLNVTPGGETGSIIVGEDDDMASLSVTLFFGAITLSLFLFGFLKEFSKNPVANLIFKRVCILLGMFLLSLDTSMIVTISTNAGLGIDREIFRYLFFINWSIYLFMVWLFVSTLFNVLTLWKKQSMDKRMGNEGEDYV